jgi:Fe/S biogenesis protein NfuA
MITVTEAAITQIKSLQESNDAMGMAIRVKVRENGPAAFEYNVRFVPVEDKTEQDQAIEEDGIAFYIDEESASMVRGASLDFVESVQGAGFKFDNPNKPPLLNDPLAARVHQILEEKINPGVASHGGRVALMDVKDGRVYLRLGGGCQGCGMVDVTLKQGIEATLKEEIPEIIEVLDTTDHASGTNPYYEPGG